MPRIVQAHWEFHCPECGLGHHEHRRLATDHELYCEICEHEAGRRIRLLRWPADAEPDPDRVTPRVPE